MKSRSESLDHLNQAFASAQRSPSPTQHLMNNSSASSSLFMNSTNSLSSSAAGSSMADVFSLQSLNSISSESSSILGGVALSNPLVMTGSSSLPAMSIPQMPSASPLSIMSGGNGNFFGSATTPTPSPPPLPHSHGHSQSGASQPPGTHQRNPAREIFVGDLSFFCDEIHLFEHFSQYGRVENCRIMKNDTRTKSLMYGFMTMATEQEASTAAHALNNTMFMGRCMKVELSDKKPARGQSNRGANSGVINRNEVHVSFVSSFLPDKIIRPTEVFLRHYFQRFGNIADIVVREYVCHQSMARQEGYGFITFEETEAAVAAAQECSSVLLEGIVVTTSLNDRVRGSNQHSHVSGRESTASGAGGIAFSSNTITAPTPTSSVTSSTAPGQLPQLPSSQPQPSMVRSSVPSAGSAGVSSTGVGVPSASFSLASMSSPALPSPQEISSSNSLELDLMQRSMSWDRPSSNPNSVHSTSSISMSTTSYHSLQSFHSLQSGVQTPSTVELFGSSTTNRGVGLPRGHSSTSLGVTGAAIGGSSSGAPSPVDHLVTFEDLVAAQARAQQSLEQQALQHRIHHMQQQQLQQSQQPSPSQQHSAYLQQQARLALLQQGSFSFDLSEQDNSNESPISIQGVASSATLSAAMAGNGNPAYAPPFPAALTQPPPGGASPLPVDTRVPRSQLRAVTRYYPEIGSPFEVLLPLASKATNSVIGPGGIVTQQAEQASGTPSPSPSSNRSISFSLPNPRTSVSVSSYIQQGVHRGENIDGEGIAIQRMESEAEAERTI